MTAAALFRTAGILTTDADLLGRFVSTRDETAFAELVRRHGPVVYRICRRLAGPNSADDAFQASFLVLATRADRVRKAASVGSWLVGVAGRVARQMRRRERRFSPPLRLGEGAGGWGFVADLTPQYPLRTGEGEFLAAVLDDELARLPDRLRAPLVACLIQHRTHKQAAAELGESERTLRRRLDEAKRVLRVRLERRGVVPAVAAGLVSGVGAASAAVPRELAERTVNLVFDFLAGGVAVASAPASIAKGVTMSGTLWKAKVLLAGVAVGLTALGVGLAGDPPKVEEKPREKPLTTPQLPLEYRAPAEFGQWTFTYHPADDVKTKNFVVKCPDAVIARAVANEAEHQRKALAERWLGKELPAWEKPCVITVEDRSGGVDGERQLAMGKFFDTGMNLLRYGVPMEVLPAVLAAHFGKSWDGWPDTGVALFQTAPEVQAANDRTCRDVLNNGKGIPLRKLLPMTFDRTAEIKPTEWAQGHSLVRFLFPRVPSGGNPFRHLIDFLADGLKTNTPEGWDAAVKKHYGFADADALQEAWLDWLRKPESVMEAKVKPAAEKESRIPPAKLPK